MGKTISPERMDRLHGFTKEELDDPIRTKIVDIFPLNPPQNPQREEIHCYCTNCKCERIFKYSEDNLYLCTQPGCKNTLEIPRKK